MFLPLFSLIIQKSEGRALPRESKGREGGRAGKSDQDRVRCPEEGQVREAPGVCLPPQCEDFKRADRQGRVRQPFDHPPEREAC